MKKTRQFFAIIFYCLVPIVQGQDSTKTQASDKWTDISIFFIDRFNPKLNRPLMWFSHEEGKYFIEGRMNFDYPETAGMLLGKTLSKNERFWFTPKTGILFSQNNLGYDGISLETNLGGKLGNFKYFVMLQRAISLNSKPSFAYSYTQLGYRVKWLQFNYSAQFFSQLAGSGVWIDHGPQIIIFLKKIYVKPWYTWDIEHKVQKFVIGLGYHF